MKERVLIRYLRLRSSSLLYALVLVVSLPSLSPAIGLTDLPLFLTRTGPNRVATFEDVPVGASTPFTSGGATFLPAPGATVSSSLVGQPHSFWFKSNGSRPNFYGTLVEFSVSFPSDVNAFGFVVGAFAGDTVTPFAWTLYSASGVSVGTGFQSAASVFSTGFLGVISSIPFKSVTITRISTGGGAGAYVIDDFRYALSPITVTGTITTYAGTVAGGTANGFGGDGGPATSAQLSGPFGLAMDRAGTLFIADTGNQRIRKVTPNGIITTVAGNGAPGFSGDGGPATSAQLSSPMAVSVDTAGNLFITDYGNHRIRKVSAAGLITTVAGIGTPSFSGDGGPATSAGLNLTLAASTAVDAAGNLLIPDTGNNRLRKVTPQGVITTIAGTGDPGFSGDGGPAINAGVSPTAVAVDSSGNIFLHSYAHNRVRKVTPEGLITTIAGNGEAGVSGDDGPALSASIYGSWGVTLDSAGNLFITDAYRVRKVTPAGIITTIAGGGSGFGPGFAGDGGPATAASLSPAPRGVAIDATDNLFIADTGNSRVRKVTFEQRTQFTLIDHGGLSVVSSGTSPSLRTGYASIQPNAGSPTPAGLAIFGFRQNNILVSEAGVPASPLIVSGRIYAEIDGPVNTGLAIANPNNQPATISFYFTDSKGSSSTVTTTIPANAQIARFLNDPPFIGPASLSGTLTFNSSMPVAVIALRGLTNERGEFLITTLPVADLRAPAATGTTVLPHFADGAGWKTQLVLVNTGDSTLTGTVQFADASGVPTIVMVNGQSNNSFAYSIPSRSAQKLQTSGGGTEIVSGSVRVIPDNNDAAPSGLAVFSYRNGGVTVAEAGVPAAAAGTAFRLYAEFAGAIQTGIAVANTSAAAATVTLDLTKLDGSSTGLTGTLSISANGQTAVFLNQIPGFASLPASFQGVLRISSASPLAVTGLRGRYNERNDFLITTTPPVNEAAGPSSSAVFFPHIADSGGYTTQFILFSAQPGPPATGIMQFFSQAGGALNVAMQ